MQNESEFVSRRGGPLEKGTPGPDFWSWTPPLDIDDGDSGGEINSISAEKASHLPTQIQNSPVIEREKSVGFLSIPFEGKLFESKHNSPLPPLQSLIDTENVELFNSSINKPHLEEEHDLGVQFSTKAAEAANALSNMSELSYKGVNPDGSKWWKETGTEQRPDGVICKWTLTRCVSADKSIEWEEKYWEAANEFGHKELGSEKSGRDASGNVWHEYWKESMWQVRVLFPFYFHMNLPFLFICYYHSFCQRKTKDIEEIHLECNNLCLILN